MIIGGSSDIDEEYAKDFYPPIELGSEKNKMHPSSMEKKK